MENQKSNSAKETKSTVAKPKESAAPVKVAPLFRPIDWISLAITFGIIWAIYLFTLAPEQTLEDSGELCTAAFYAGIPHPPGYPFWSVYAWFWTWILPFGNVAWRVEVGQSFAAAMGCGLLALMVSRGSSMMMEGIEVIKGIPARLENSICMISGSAPRLPRSGCPETGAGVWRKSIRLHGPFCRCRHRYRPDHSPGSRSGAGG